MFSLLLFLSVSLSLLPFAAAAQTVHNATTVTTVGWVSDGDNARSTISLLYNCLFTIFLCTWSAMHLNVPAESDSPLHVFWRKCRWMFVGVLAPEFVAVLAFEEWNIARKLVRSEPHLPTTSHGFFLIMGGYSIDVKEIAEDGPAPRRIRLNPEDFLKLAKFQSFELPAKVELMDKSKGDWISKSITSIQVIWFVSQVVGRAVQKLPVTTLELFTCAIVVCAAVTYAAWWNKPLDVQRSIVLDSKVPAASLVEHRIEGFETYLSLMDGGGLPLAYALSHLYGLYFFAVTATAVGALHVIGWNFYFPTRTEQLLWRVASILCAGIPILALSTTFANDSKRIGSRLKQLNKGLAWIGLGAYFLVRAYLLVEVFVSLRSVPADVYTAVNWSAYIPHI